MQLTVTVKKEYLGLCDNAEQVTHLSVYCFYLRDSGYQLEVWPVKKQQRPSGDEYSSVVGLKGKCITLVEPTEDDMIDTLNIDFVRQMLPEEKENLVKSVLEEHGWQLSGEIVNE